MPLEVGRPSTSLRLTEHPWPWWRPFLQQARGVEQYRTSECVKSLMWAVRAFLGLPSIDISLTRHVRSKCLERIWGSPLRKT